MCIRDRAIKTFVSNFSDGIIREALLREFKRGGQVYFLHNDCLLYTSRCV